MMTLSIALSAKTAAVLARRAAAAGKDTSTYAVDAIEEKLAEAEGSNGDFDALSPAQRAAAWREWAANHRKLDYVADDSRESIYAGRGE